MFKNLKINPFRPGGGAVIGGPKVSVTPLTVCHVAVRDSNSSNIDRAKHLAGTFSASDSDPDTVYWYALTVTVAGPGQPGCDNTTSGSIRVTTSRLRP